MKQNIKTEIELIAEEKQRQIEREEELSRLATSKAYDAYPISKN